MAESTRKRLEITVENGCCDGHFPGNPIVPAAAQAQWMLDLAAAHFATQSMQIDRLKLHRELKPGTVVDIIIEPKNNRLHASVRDADGAYSEMFITATNPQ
ncbi:MAG: hypothetical protein ACQKBV_02100 [Puniceicoccales bacterium]